MNIYKVSRTDDWSYGEYDSFVCAAESEDRAKMMNPDGEWDAKYSGWIPSQERDTLEVERIGLADHGVHGILLKSFNAG